MSDRHPKLRDPIAEARERMTKARDELQKAAVRYSLGGITDEEFQEFLLEHYKAQMEMSKLVEHWPAYQRRE